MNNVCFQIKVLELCFPMIHIYWLKKLKKLNLREKTAADKSALIKACQYVLAEFVHPEFENGEYFNIWFISPGGKSAQILYSVFQNVKIANFWTLSSSTPGRSKKI